VSGSLHGAFALIAITLLITFGYIVRAWLKPFKNCRRCHGYGRIHPRTRRGHPRICRKCKGTGLRPRAFRRPARAAQRTWNDARR
jgi:DnaJ-class molecular chaperone